ncbi:tRNA 4-thiouridine(8) synthase ThiI [Candidatus Woesearchaeota archaeon]|nr:tRNA 4-thiouridine(8) synthase ThiI [Candidatus Woesearchaeota archaeon]
MQKVLIHYAEISLKGKNRAYFEDKAIENIKKSSNYHNANLKKIRKEHKRLLCIFDDQQEKINKALHHVFGIQYFCYVEEVSPNLEAIERYATKFLETAKENGHKSIAFKTKRVDKEFSLTSVEINTRFGEFAQKLDIKVDYTNALITLFTEISRNNVYFFSEKIPGLKGLPVSTGGRALVLLSGGIDSPVAAWQMMGRGCSVDFLHVHTFRTNEEVFSTKIFEIVKILNEYQFKSTLYLVPYASYEAFVSWKIQDKYDLVFFKHYLLKLAESLAMQKDYDAIATGDNLGQVASQTIENIKASQLNIKLPVLMPLLTFNKEKIIEQAKLLGTYQLSIKPYKDCCSLFTKHPTTRTKLGYFEGIASSFNMDFLLEKNIASLKIVDLP